ncbi:MAG: hypothetical protein AUK47_03555 [Deltaproteobacteria bacterium CG2_30_63_29]|nr:MAG: hypothetical protein AUK47_03555 [Deltaproteobacteria bacterium CG2_30_63_29]PJB39004.1 MAG: hypothetical protein CO108_18050 [Deltaproteobacteria bacterium CG_4_9_14_3_um_filter_63_12]
MSHKLHHLALGAAEPDVLARFYGEVFGLSELDRHFDAQGQLRSVWLQLQPGILMIERSERARPPVDGVDAGLFLLAFEVAPHEREALERRLSDAGCPIESRSAFTSYARDPEGNRVAVSHYPQAQWARGF